MNDWDISYEIYLINGFDGLDRNGTANFSDAKGLRDSRPSLKVDNNNSTAGVGRIAVSPLLGTELGTSLHLGKYDEAGHLWLALWAIDLTLKPGIFFEILTPLEIIGEIASAEIERNALARTSGIPSDIWGAYAQINYHFMFDCLTEGQYLSKVFTENSTFTAVTRIDHVELGSNQMERITFGVNFRPIEDTVLKFDYQLNFNNWNRASIKDDAFVFSVATYF